MCMSTTILLTAHEAAHALRILPARLKRMAKSGDVPVVMLPDGEPRFDPADLREWVATMKTKPQEVRHAGT